MNRHFVHTLTAASLVVLGASSAPCQEKSPSLFGSPAPAPEKRFDIELEPGLPAREAVQQIAQRLKQPLNVIFTGDSAETALPALRLHQVTLPEFFAAVQAAGQIETSNGRAGYFFAPVDGAPNIYTFTVQSPADPPTIAGQTGVLTLTGGGGLAAAAPAPEKTSLFFDLSAILDDKLKIEDITTAIRTAWTAAEDGKEPPPEALKFHQETKLLIATGYPSRLNTVSGIIKLLEERNRPSTDEKIRAIERLEHSRAEAERQYSTLMKKLEQAETDKEEQVKTLRNRIAELEIELAKREKKF